AFFCATVIHIMMSIAVLLSFGLVLACNHHVARTAAQKPAEWFWVVVLGRSFVLATVDNFLDIVKQPFRDNRGVLTLKDFACIAKMPIIKWVCKEFGYLVFFEWLVAFGFDTSTEQKIGNIL